jgi:hypothetical protein
MAFFHSSETKAVGSRIFVSVRTRRHRTLTVYDWGGEEQVDWYEAVAEIGGERQSVHHFAMRSMASGGAFHVAYYHATQQAFLEGHESAFGYFGGVFRRLRYDNAYRSIRTCDERLTEETESFRVCVEDTEVVIKQLKILARSHRERVQYALIANYLRTVRGCRNDWEQSDASTDAKSRLKELESYRRNLIQRLRAD